MIFFFEQYAFVNIIGTQTNQCKHLFFYRFKLLNDHFSIQCNPIAMEGPLYVKIESRKVWKRYHCVLRASGIYYYPKDKTKSQRDLLCHSIFIGHEVYKGIAWKKKHKAPTDFTFALKSQQEGIGIDTRAIQRTIKMMCTEDHDTLDRWITAIRVAKYGKLLLDSHRTLIEDLSREELDKFSSNRSVSIGSIVSCVTSQCSGSKITSNNELQIAKECLCRASSSCSNGCLSDENNVFDSDVPMGTIKRKPSMKPILPLTSMTRQLKEVGKNTFVNDPISSEKSGPLSRRHSRKRSEESIGSNSNNGTLMQRPPTTRSSIENMKSSNSIAVVESCIPDTCGQMDQQPDVDINNIENNKNTEEASPLSPLKAMPPCMTDSMFSLPPPPEEFVSLSGSTISLDIFPPPPTPSELLLQEISVPSVSAGSIHNRTYNITTNIGNSNKKNLAAPKPPPRAEATRLSTIPSPILLPESNPARDFIKDLHRVMRKKWQVAQKCKLEPTTTPYEVLGFRDFANAAAASASGIEFRDTPHYYRETANVSNWVQEHYGNLGICMGLEPSPTILKPPPPAPPKRNTTTQLTKVHLYQL